MYLRSANAKGTKHYIMSIYSYDEEFLSRFLVKQHVLKACFFSKNLGNSCLENL